MKNLRCGVIGIGNMGTAHAQSISRGAVAGLSLAAAADPREDRMAWAKSELPAEVAWHQTGEELIAQADLDVVIIATPHYSHPPLAAAAFAKGLHVVIEKPAGVYTRAVREMNRAAEAAGKIFAIMYQMRAVPLHQKMRELAQSGEIGEIRRIHWVATDWYRTQAYYDSGGWRATWAGEGGGVLLNQCPHPLDLLWWIPGLMPSRVRAFMSFGKYHDIEVEDDVTAYLEYANGATGVFMASTGEAPGANRVQISGDGGSLLLEHGQLTLARNRVPVSTHLKTARGGFDTPECWKIAIPVPPNPGNEHNIILRNVVEAIRDGKPLLAPGPDGLNGLSISNAMHLSAWTDAWAPLPVDEDAFMAHLDEKRRNSRHKTGAGQTLDLKASFKGTP